ncbi:MAG: class I SAM-dependent methyltransferase [Sandaracinaceae bacterium]|nr:class I SAM-dependent methyltransferase [Sandaracinaceae bacterium]
MWQDEVSAGERFEFGANWKKFARAVDDERVQEARRALAASLRVDSLAGKSFLDVGGGSGIHSLAARLLGARVHTFDYDPSSVECARTLRDRFAPGDADWTIEQGSALDASYLAKLGHFDIVYSWGVLHHTGDMWRALELVEERVKPGGLLFLALYNDQGRVSRLWTRVKKAYVGSPRPGKMAITIAAGLYFESRSALGRVLRLENPLPFAQWEKKKRDRGMSVWTDLVDWVGGYPFEVSKPEEIFELFRTKGYRLEHLRTCGGGLGCNEYVFRNERSE